MALFLLCSCERKENMKVSEGTLSFASFNIECDVTTKAAPAPGNYTIIIRNSEGDVAKTTTYTAVKADGGTVSLPAGSYTLEARSSEDEVPAAAFEQPVYGAGTDFVIVAGETTEIGTLTCTLLQCKVTVSYDDAFLATVTGNGKATVTVDPSAPLEYLLTYANGSVSYDQSAGYFAVNNGENTTMSVVFSGSIGGKSQKMTATLVNIEPRQWRQVKFIKKVDTQGNATFAIVINGYVDDEELTVDLAAAAEDVIGEDPDAPKGDGGITLEFASDCTMFSNLDEIVVPAEGVMDLRLVATVPNGVKKFVVNIASSSAAFVGAVDAAGGSQLDLVNPSPESEIVFQIVPFTHGSELVGMTSIPFDLSGAQEAILAFPGEHTFTMDITDLTGCRKQVPVKLIVR